MKADLLINGWYRLVLGFRIQGLGLKQRPTASKKPTWSGCIKAEEDHEAVASVDVMDRLLVVQIRHQMIGRNTGIVDEVRIATRSAHSIDPGSRCAVAPKVC